MIDPGVPWFAFAIDELLDYAAQAGESMLDFYPWEPGCASAILDALEHLAAAIMALIPSDIRERHPWDSLKTTNRPPSPRNTPPVRASFLRTTRRLAKARSPLIRSTPTPMAPASSPDRRRCAGLLHALLGELTLTTGAPPGHR